MSDIIKKTAQLIAEAEALLARAQQTVAESEARTQQVAQDPQAWRSSIERELGPQGQQRFEKAFSVIQEHIHKQRSAPLHATLPADPDEPNRQPRRRHPRSIV